MTPIISGLRQLVMSILAGSLFPTASARADSTIPVGAPPVVELTVTCEYIEGAVSPLQMRVEGFGPGVPFIVEFKNVQTGASHRMRPVEKRWTPGSPKLLYFPLLQTGTYDVMVSWIAEQNGVIIPDTSQAMFLFKGLTIPIIKLTGGRGTGCQV